MTSVKSLLKQPDFYRRVLSIILLTAMVYCGIYYVNAGAYYFQQIAFRPFCISLGLLILVNLDYKIWFNLISLIYVPICYVFMHFACLYKWIPDVTDYQHVDVIRMGKLVALVWGIVVISILVDAVKKKVWKNIGSVNRVVLALWIVFAILSVVFMREHYYFFFMAIAFSALFYTFSIKERRDIIVDSLSTAICLSMVYVFYKCLRCRPYDCERYTLYFANANSAGMYISAVVVAAMVKLERWWQYDGKLVVKKIMLVAYYCGFGVATGLMIFNFTRTTILGVIAALVLKYVIAFKHADKKKSVLGRFIIGFVVFVAFLCPTYLGIRYVPGYFNTPYFFAGEYDPVVRIMPGDPIDSPKYTTIESFLTLALGKCGIYINFNPDEEAGEKAVYYNEEKDVTNGRGSIWRGYLSKMNLTGHYPANMTLDDGFFVYHAHNTYIHVSYQLGAIAGIEYLIFMGVCFFTSIIAYFKSKAKDNTLLFGMCFIAAGCVSQLTEWIGHPCYILYVTLFFAIGTVLYKTDKL